jgi:succinate dehydrogenase (ubiquinone) cytochrome b560 subunit
MLASSRAALRARGVPQAALGFAARDIGGGGVPSEWGQPKTGGTQFLGTPTNYMQLLKTRPVSPDLFGVEGAEEWSEQRCARACFPSTSGSHEVPTPTPGGAHYKFPPVAVSSITNRVTGVVLSGGACVCVPPVGG